MSKARDMADLLAIVQSLDLDNNPDIFLNMGG